MEEVCYEKLGAWRKGIMWLCLEESGRSMEFGVQTSKELAPHG